MSARTQAWAAALVMIGATATSAVGDVVLEARQLLAQAAASGDWSAARADAETLFDRATAERKQDEAGFVEAAFALRLATQMAAVKDETRRRVVPVLQAHEDHARAVALLVRHEDRVDQVYNIVADLHAADAEAFAGHPSLVAAIAVVHDDGAGVYEPQPGQRPSATPVEVFHHFTTHAGRMSFGVRETPAELLVYVVDLGVSRPEAEWAMKEYAGHKQIGRAFFDVPYDKAFFKITDQDKRVWAEGYNLLNLRKYGGICADQAYYAVNVGRAIGVPSVYTRGRGGQMSHAWVGFLELYRGKQLRWNFDFGRYAEYQGVRGEIEHPQTREVTHDSAVSLSVMLFTTPEAKRRYATAAIDAAARAHAADAGGALELIEEALRKSPADLRAWRLVGEVAEAGAMSNKEKSRWADVVLKLCGDDAPDFALDTLAPMVRTVEDPRDQAALWDRLGKQVRDRPDLAAQVLVEQAELWLKHNQRAKAGQCYLAVVERFANDGPFAVEALQAVTDLLLEAGNAKAALTVFEDAWKRTKYPESVADDIQAVSNWYRVGSMYASALEKLGDGRAAQRVRRKLERIIEP